MVGIHRLNVPAIDIFIHSSIGCCFGGWGGSSHDKLPELAHQKVPKKSLRIKDQSCPGLRLSHKTGW